MIIHGAKPRSGSGNQNQGLVIGVVHDCRSAVDGMHPTFEGVKRVVTGITPAVKRALGRP